MPFAYLAELSGIPADLIERLNQSTTAAVLSDPAYRALLDSLDVARLRETLPLARAAYAQGLPAFIEKFRCEYDFANSPMSEYTLANWLVGFLEFPSRISSLPDLHQSIPREVLARGLPDILAMLNIMTQGRAEWQRAPVVLALPLLAIESPA